MVGFEVGSEVEVVVVELGFEVVVVVAFEVEAEVTFGSASPEEPNKDPVP